LLDSLGSHSLLASYAPRCQCYPPPDVKIPENIYSWSWLTQARNLENNSKLVSLFQTKQSPPSVRPVEESIESMNAWSDPSIPPRPCVIFASSPIGGWIALSAVVKIVPCVSKYVVQTIDKKLHSHYFSITSFNFRILDKVPGR
jgi:hypothetical protein